MMSIRSVSFIQLKKYDRIVLASNSNKATYLYKNTIAASSVLDKILFLSRSKQASDECKDGRCTEFLELVGEKG